MAYSYDFVEELPKELVCCICDKEMLEPRFINCCEKKFCKSCLDQWFENNSSCFHCRSEEHVIISLPLTERKIAEYKIYCPNKQHGCKVILKYKNCDIHLSHSNTEGCAYVTVDCPECKQKMFRGVLEKHTLDECPKRLVKCTYCSTEGEYQVIVGDDHKKTCSPEPILCPKGCGEKILCKDLEGHRATCLKEPVLCPYSRFGCKIEVCRENHEEHVKGSMHMAEHLSLVAGSLAMLEAKHAKLQESYTEQYSKLKAVGEYVESCVPSNFEFQPYALIYTILVGTTGLSIGGDPLNLAFSESNTKSGHHHIIISLEDLKLRCHNFMFKLQWEQIEEAGTRYFTVKLVSVINETYPAMTTEKFRVAIVVNERNKQYIRVCCGRGRTTGNPYLLGTLYFKCRQPKQMKILFEVHRSQQCSCSCPSCPCHPPRMDMLNE